MRRRLTAILAIASVILLIPVAQAFACGGLIAPGHAEVLRKATTLAAWADGSEHYITGFTFSGTADRFGYLIPLPGVPSKIEKGGGWTLERLEREIAPPVAEGAFALAAASAPRSSVEVLQQVKIEALNITVLRGGGPDVATWARANGLPLDGNSDSIFAHYRSRSVFAAVRFDRKDAKKFGLIEGQGQTIHFTIPTSGPWIPLRVLTLGRTPQEPVDADLFILTPRVPQLTPALGDMTGMTVVRQQTASASLLNDLRADQGMGWVPSGMVLTALHLSAPAATVNYDLSIDGARPVGAPISLPAPSRTALWWAIVGLLSVGAALWLRREVQPAA